MQEFQISIKAARINAEVSLKRAAEHAGITIKTLSNYEASKTVPDVNVARKLASLYGISLDNIFFEQKLR